MKSQSAVQPITFLSNPEPGLQPAADHLPLTPANPSPYLIVVMSNGGGGTVSELKCMVKVCFNHTMRENIDMQLY